MKIHDSERSLAHIIGYVNVSERIMHGQMGLSDNNNNNNNNNSGHLIDALHKKYHSALQKGNKLHYFSCTSHNTSL